MEKQLENICAFLPMDFLWILPGLKFFIQFIWSPTRVATNIYGSKQYLFVLGSKIYTMHRIYLLQVMVGGSNLRTLMKKCSNWETAFRGWCFTISLILALKRITKLFLWNTIIMTRKSFHYGTLILLHIDAALCCDFPIT